jgi:hypothetical protein
MFLGSIGSEQTWDSAGWWAGGGEGHFEVTVLAELQCGKGRGGGRLTMGTEVYRGWWWSVGRCLWVLMAICVGLKAAGRETGGDSVDSS